MTAYEVEHVAFSAEDVACWADSDPRLRNWPVVYTLDDRSSVYVGETHNVAARFRQHLDSVEKSALSRGRVIIDDTFNKSACLDLESFLIRMFAGDGQMAVLNRNSGMVDADYYQREEYQKRFNEIFEGLRDEGFFVRTAREIENTDLFKLSPFKALTSDQAIAVENILDGLFEDLARGTSGTTLIEGGPGTGKTIVAIYLIKLLVDIRDAGRLEQAPDGDSLFSDYFTEGYPELLADFRLGLVVPQQSLRKSVQKVFDKTPGLDPEMVLSPFEVGEAEEPFDLLIVDETHRLNHRANQPSGMKNRQFAEINHELFGSDGDAYTQLDWILTQSKNRVLLIDNGQTVRPSDIPPDVLSARLSQEPNRQHMTLTSQLRVDAGEDYIGYVRSLLSNDLPEPRSFESYEFAMFDELGDMVRAIQERDMDSGLARLVAGYAWKWLSKKDKSAHDIVVGDVRLRWNSSELDWVNSAKSTTEVGSIHTIQGYDLNYAGVIVGPDLRWDVEKERLVFDRAHYFDTKGMENNNRLGIRYTDDDILEYVRNIYSVLMTRGIRGTFVYVCNPALRERWAKLIPPAAPATPRAGA